MTRTRLAVLVVAIAAALTACGAAPPPAVAPTPGEPAITSREPALPTGFIAPARDTAADLEARNESLQP